VSELQSVGLQSKMNFGEVVMCCVKVIFRSVTWEDWGKRRKSMGQTVFIWTFGLGTSRIEVQSAISAPAFSVWALLVKPEPVIFPVSHVLLYFGLSFNTSKLWSPDSVCFYRYLPTCRRNLSLSSSGYKHL
jgi:hypothetical protein